jgi:AcrR family transcriptional regulator
VKPSTQTLSRQQAKKHTEQRLLDAAAGVFRRDGFHAADLRRVARRAGVTTGALYWSFHSKADLFLAVYDRYLDQRFKEVRALIQEPDPSRRNIQAIEEWFHRLDEHRDWHRVLLEFRLYAARDPELNAKFLDRHHRFLEASARGFVKPGQAPSQRVLEITTAFIALANGYALERLNDPDRVTAEQHARAAQWLLQSVIPAFKQRSNQ